jgi:hypothetical protein
VLCTSFLIGGQINKKKKTDELQQFQKLFSASIPNVAFSLSQDKKSIESEISSVPREKSLFEIRI